MRKLLVAAVAVVMTTSAFAQSNMVRFTNFWDSTETRSFDVSFGTEKDKGGVKDANSATSNVALNYARAFGQYQVGFTYKNYNSANTNMNTVGLSAYYNMAKDLTNTCYVGLHYDMAKNKSDDKTNTITVEYGHRFNIGSAWGMNLTYAPSLAYSQATTELDAGGEDAVKSNLTWNWAKVDVLF